MTSQPDYYAVLRVNPAASQHEISRAYRALMRTYHPDVDDGMGHERDVQDAELLRIMQAFSALRDPARRAAYDRSRAGSTAQGAATAIPVRKVSHRILPAGNTIRIMPVRWEHGPWK
jgi:DnaJ-class molecular chaperone